MMLDPLPLSLFIPYHSLPSPRSWIILCSFEKRKRRGKAAALIRDCDDWYGNGDDWIGFLVHKRPREDSEILDNDESKGQSTGMGAWENTEFKCRIQSVLLPSPLLRLQLSATSLCLPLPSPCLSHLPAAPRFFPCDAIDVSITLAPSEARMFNSWD